MRQFGSKNSLGAVIYFLGILYIFFSIFIFDLSYIFFSFFFFFDNEEDMWLGYMTNDVIGLEYCYDSKPLELD